MAVLDRDRKLLWGRAGNRCALCRRELVLPGTADDPAAVIGDEAHIVARSPGGPRYRVLAPSDVDAYDNLVLLCKVDHKRADDQPETFSEQQLRDAKRLHEEWVRSALALDRVAEPIRVRARPGAREPLLRHLATGGQVWDVISPAQAWQFSLMEDHDRGDVVTDVAEEFLDLVRDYAQISDDVADAGLRAVREAKRQFDGFLTSLASYGMVVFGTREEKIIEGGVLPPAPWIEATLLVLPVERALEWSQEPDGEDDGDVPS